MGEQMRELVAQSAVDFGRTMVAQADIQRNQVATEIGASGGAAKSRIPFHTNERS